NLVDFVQENYSRVFHAIDGGARYLLHVDQALLFFLNQIFEGFVDLHLPLLGALAEDVGEHVFQVNVHLFDALVGDDFEGREIALAGFDFHCAVVEFAFAQLLDSGRLVLASMTTPPVEVEDDEEGGGLGGSRISSRRSSALSSALSE